MNENVSFETGSIDGGGNHTIVSYKWDFGDGFIENGTDLSQSSYIESTHRYSSEGNYTVKLTVTNDQGHTDVDTYHSEVEIISDVKSKFITSLDLNYGPCGYDKYKTGDFKIFRKTRKGLGEPQVGEDTIIKGSEYVLLKKYSKDRSLEKVWDIPVSGDPIFIHIYKNDVKIFDDIVLTNNYGEFTCYFRPKEAGDHKLVVQYPGPFVDYPNWGNKEEEYWFEEVFFVSEKLEQEQPQSPGFEAVFIITALLAVVYLLRMKNNRNP